MKPVDNPSPGARPTVDAGLPSHVQNLAQEKGTQFAQPVPTPDHPGNLPDDLLKGVNIYMGPDEDSSPDNTTTNEGDLSREAKGLPRGDVVQVVLPNQEKTLLSVDVSKQLEKYKFPT